MVNKYTNIEADVALCKCKPGKIFGIRMEKTSAGWIYDWAFKITQERAQTEGYEKTEIKGNIYPSEEYPGCPYCKSKAFYICGTCKKLNCYDYPNKIYTCGWCNNTISGFDEYDGSGIRSASDA